MEKDDCRAKVIESASRWLNDQVRLPGELKRSDARPRGAIDNQNVGTASCDDCVIGGLEPSHWYRWLKPTPVPQLCPLAYRTLLEVQIRQHGVHAQ
jgi:hypothetical protein